MIRVGEEAKHSMNRNNKLKREPMENKDSLLKYIRQCEENDLLLPKAREKKFRNYRESLSHLLQPTLHTASSRKKPHTTNKLMYGIDDTPNICLCAVLGFQHFITMFGSTIAIPFLLAPSLCLSNNPLALGDIISTVFFISGVATILQVSLGVRLPIIQGATFAFLAPTLVILESNDARCASNGTDPAEWKENMREIQGAIISSSCVQVFIGLTGFVGFFTKFISPITVASTISLLGLGLFQSVGLYVGQSWLLSSVNIIQVTLFSQVLGRKFKIFKMFPVVLSIATTWSLSIILEHYGFLNAKKHKESNMKTKQIVLYNAEWFQIPRPFQWGFPKFILQNTLGMMSAVFVSVLESIGNYNACARIANIPPPPKHAVNRGIAMEGILCVLAGIWGSGNGTTSYSENIATIGVTKVGSRRVILCSAVIMLLLSVFPKFSAAISLMPEAIIGGMLWILFGMLLSVGLSMLQFIDLNSTRNMFVLGFTLYGGMLVPDWTRKNRAVLNTGIAMLDNVIFILLSTNMSIGAFTAILLDNLIPMDIQEGTSEHSEHCGQNKAVEHLCCYHEKEIVFQEKKAKNNSSEIYDLPYIQKYLDGTRWAKYLPFLPNSSNERTMYFIKDERDTYV